MSFESRKQDHIRLALESAHQATEVSGLDQIHLPHEALPDLDLSEVTLESVCLGKTSPTPFYVAGMTAGHADAPELNRRLARACEARGWAMGVGSQRRDLEVGNQQSPDHWAMLRKEVPRLTLFANLGISQIIRASTTEIHRLVELIEAQALVVHLNALQECFQPEGTPQFRGAFDALKRVVRELEVPVVLKETGCGFSKSTLRRLGDIGLRALDVSGLGGTHWGRIEGARALQTPGGAIQAQASRTFAQWGETTVDSVRWAREVFSEGQPEIWGSGGVRSGLDAAKLIALGAHQVGYAQPALKAALAAGDAGSENALLQWMEQQEFELRVALFCTGSANPKALRHLRGTA